MQFLKSEKHQYIDSEVLEGQANQTENLKTDFLEPSGKISSVFLFSSSGMLFHCDNSAASRAVIWFAGVVSDVIIWELICNSWSGH